MNNIDNIDLNIANPVGLAWEKVENGLTKYQWYRLSEYGQPDRALIVSYGEHWAIQIWIEAAQTWAKHGTTYADIDEAKAVAMALAAMESK